MTCETTSTQENVAQGIVVTAEHVREISNSKRLESALMWAVTEDGEKILSAVNDRINLAADEGKFETTINHSVLSSVSLSNLWVHFEDFRYLLRDIDGFNVEEIEKPGGEFMISW